MNVIFLKNKKISEGFKCNNSFCCNKIKRSDKTCFSFFLDKKYDDDAVMCPYGFTAVFRTGYVLCGFVSDGVCDKNKIKWIRKVSTYGSSMQCEKLSSSQMTDLINFLVLYDHQTISSHTKHELTNFIGQLKTLVENFRSNEKEEIDVVALIKGYITIYNDFDSHDYGYSNVIRKIFNNNDLIANLNNRFLINDLRKLVDLYDDFIIKTGNLSERIKTYLVNNKINFKDSSNNNYKSIVYMHELFLYRVRYHKSLLNEEQQILKHVKYNWYTMTDKHSSMMEYVADKKKIAFNICKPRGRVENDFFGDENIYLALYIILENAVKFSPYGKKIYINIYDELNDSVIEIKNHSAYISEESIAHIFDRGFFGENSNSSNSTGLGLYLVKTIFDENNITIDASYDDGVFKILLKAHCNQIDKF